MMKTNNTLLWMALIFLIPGAFPDEKRNTEAQAGDNIIFSTERAASTEKLPYIEWTVNGNRIVTYADGWENRAQAYAERIELDHFTGNLKLKNVLSTDSGDYTYSVKTADDVLNMKKRKKSAEPKAHKGDFQECVQVVKCAIPVVCVLFSVVFLLCAPSRVSVAHAREPTRVRAR